MDEQLCKHQANVQHSENSEMKADVFRLEGPQEHSHKRNERGGKTQEHQDANKFDQVGDDPAELSASAIEVT